MFRPAGFSDDDDSDNEFYDGFARVPTENVYHQKMEKQRQLNNAIEEAIDSGDLKKLQDILVNDLSKDPNSRLSSGWTLLMHACHNAQHTIVEYLLSCDADVNLHCDSLTPLMVLCKSESVHDDIIISILYSLLEKGATPNIGDKFGETPLMKAIACGKVAIVKELLKQHINIEMRDRQGWTAVFWSVHYNQPLILEILIEKGCRLNEVDCHKRTVLDIAQSHNFKEVMDILNKHLSINDDENGNNFVLQASEWTDYYPGIKDTKVPTYKHEISHLLCGMNCENLVALFHNANIDLRTFLLLDDKKIIKLGIEMPYERRRVEVGLRKFHTRHWKVKSVPGINAHKLQNYSILECVHVLASHLYQIYIMEASLQYTLRTIRALEAKLKFEPENSTVMAKINEASNNIASNIATTKQELKLITSALKKIQIKNPAPPELVKGKNKAEFSRYKIENILITSIVILTLGFGAKRFVTLVSSLC